MVLVDLQSHGCNEEVEHHNSGSGTTVNEKVRVVLQPHRYLTATCILDLSNKASGNNNVLIASGDDAGLVHVFDVSTPHRPVDTPYTSPVLPDGSLGDRWGTPLVAQQVEDEEKEMSFSHHSKTGRYYARSFVDLANVAGHTHSSSSSSSSSNASPSPVLPPSSSNLSFSPDVDAQQPPEPFYRPRAFFTSPSQLPTYRVVSSFYLRAEDEPFFVSSTRGRPQGVTAIVDPYVTTADFYARGGMLLCQRQPQQPISALSSATPHHPTSTATLMWAGMKHDRIGRHTPSYSPPARFSVRESQENVGLWMASMVKDMVWQVPLRRHPSDVTAQVRLEKVKRCGRGGRGSASEDVGAFATITSTSPGLDTGCTLHHPSTLETVLHFSLLSGTMDRASGYSTSLANDPIVVEPFPLTASQSTLRLQQRTIQSVVWGQTNEVWISAVTMATGTATGVQNEEGVVFIFDIRKPSQPIEMKTLWSARNAAGHGSCGPWSCACSCGSETTATAGMTTTGTDPSISSSSCAASTAGCFLAGHTSLNTPSEEEGGTVGQGGEARKKNLHGVPASRPVVRVAMAEKQKTTRSPTSVDCPHGPVMSGRSEKHTALHCTGDESDGGHSRTTTRTTRENSHYEDDKHPHSSPPPHPYCPHPSGHTSDSCCHRSNSEYLTFPHFPVDDHYLPIAPTGFQPPSPPPHPHQWEKDPALCSPRSTTMTGDGRNNGGGSLPCVVAEYLEDDCFAVLSVPPCYGTITPPPIRSAEVWLSHNASRNEGQGCLSPTAPTVGEVVHQKNDTSELHACGALPSCTLSCTSALHTFRCTSTGNVEAVVQSSKVATSGTNAVSSIVQHHCFPLPPERTGSKSYTTTTAAPHHHDNNNNHHTQQKSSHTGDDTNAGNGSRRSSRIRLEGRTENELINEEAEDDRNAETGVCPLVVEPPQHERTVQQDLVYYNGVLYILRG